MHEIESSAQVADGGGVQLLAGLPGAGLGAVLFEEGLMNDEVASSGFLAVFGFFGSRLPRSRPLAMSVVLN
jgi:hypothetical protein